MSRSGDEALEVLRGVWSARGQSTTDLDEALGSTKSCKRMQDVGFDGLAGPDSEGDLRAAWRETLRREGKLRPGADSIAELVLDPAETS
jgi:hypothetical protein